MKLDEFIDLMSQLQACYNGDDDEGLSWYVIYEELGEDKFIEFVRQFNWLYGAVSKSMNAYSMLSLMSGMAMSDSTSQYNNSWLMYQGYDAIKKAIENPDLLVEQFSDIDLMEIDTESYTDHLYYALEDMYLESDEEGDAFEVTGRDPENPLYDDIEYSVEWDEVREYSKTNLPRLYEQYGDRFSD